MYAQQSLQDSLFLMLYGGVAMLAVVAGLYLWIGRSNAILPDITPPRALRRWTTAFFLMATPTTPTSTACASITSSVSTARQRRPGARSPYSSWPTSAATAATSGSTPPSGSAWAPA